MEHTFVRAFMDELGLIKEAVGVPPASAMPARPAGPRTTGATSLLARAGKLMRRHPGKSALVAGGLGLLAGRASKD